MISMSRTYIPQKSNSYIRRLHQDLMLRFMEIVDPDYLLEQDENAYEKIQRDATIAALIRQMKHRTVGQRWFFSPSNDRGKDLVPYFTDLMAELGEDEIQKFLFNLTEAVLKGMALAKIEGEWKYLLIGNDTQYRWWWVPTRIIDIDKRRIRIIRDGNERTLRHFWAIYDIVKNEWVEIEDTSKYIWHFYDKVEGFPMGRGLGGSLYYYWYAKTVLYELMLQGAERWAGGWVVAYIDGLKRATQNAFKDRATQQKWIDELDKMISHGILVMPKGDDLRIEQGPTQGHSIIMDSMKYLDESISLLLLSSNLPMINQGGSYALARVKADEQDSGPIQYNRISLAGSVTKYLVWNNIWRNNLPNFRALGLGHLRPPRFMLDNTKIYDPQKEISIVQQARNAGIPLKKQEVYERLGYTMPDGSESPDELIGTNTQSSTSSSFPFQKEGRKTFASVKSADEEKEDLTKHVSKKLSSPLKKLWQALFQFQMRGEEPPEELAQELLEVMKKMQAFADLKGRKRTVLEAKAKGLETHNGTE
ncbi:MAG: DUF935 family protein [Methanobacteriota archaeon]|nr:MAG: DUF935 family protein [Euryarchaeota archaeon]